MDVQMPDGATITGVPDGMTQVELMRRYRGHTDAAPILGGADPTGSFGENMLAGVGKAITDTGRGLRQIGSYVGFGDKAAIQQEIDDAKRLDAPLMNTGGGLTGNIGGQIGMALGPGTVLKGAAMLPQLARVAPMLSAAGSAAIVPKTIAGAATVGAAQGAVQPVASDDSRLMNMALGAGGGTAGQAIPKGIARVVRPETSLEVRALMREGVTPTPGQILGGSAQRLEEGFTSIPYVGDIIKSGQLRAIEDLNRAAYNRALNPIGESAGKAVGNEGIKDVGAKLSRAYETILPKLNVQLDQEFGQALQGVRQLAEDLPEEQGKQFSKLFQSRVLNKFTPEGTMTGETMKHVESDLGRLASTYRGALDPDKRLMGEAFTEVQSHLRELVMRSNPTEAPVLQKINEGWANFVRAQTAAGRIGAQDGVFSPAQLLSSVRATDKSVRKGQFARGDALMQDLAKAGKNVLGQKVPDSGTPYRALAAALAGGTAGGMMLGPGAAIGGLGVAGLYTRPGQKLVASLLTSRPEFAGYLAELIKKPAPYLGPLGAAGLLNFSQQ